MLSLSISLPLTGVDEKVWMTTVLFHLKKKWRKKEKLSESLWLQGQLHIHIHKKYKIYVILHIGLQWDSDIV